MTEFVIRRMQRADLQQAIAWAAQEGWNPGLHDANSFFAADPQGFFVGESAGEPIACISAVAYDPAFGFVGLYIVKPEFRGRGWGWQLWQHAMAYLGDRTIGLDGVLAQQDNYRKSGFQLAYRNIRYQGTQAIAPTPTSLSAISEISLNELVAFDAQFFPVARPAFLQAWIAQTGSIGLAKQQGDRLMGYGMIRPAQTGWKIGPLFALSPDIAKELLNALVVYANGEPYFLDVPEPNRAAVHLAEQYQMFPMFETARMYTKTIPASAIEGVFGVTTFELG